MNQMQLKPIARVTLTECENNVMQIQSSLPDTEVDHIAAIIEKAFKTIRDVQAKRERRIILPSVNGI